MASTIVTWFTGTPMIAAGRALAIPSAASAATSKAKGRCRRTREKRGAASRTSDRLEYRIPAGFRRRRRQT